MTRIVDNMIKQTILLAPLLFIVLVPPAKAQIDFAEHDGTFSIIGRDPTTGELGIGVHSKTVAVGSRTRGGKGRPGDYDKTHSPEYVHNAGVADRQAEQPKHQHDRCDGHKIQHQNVNKTHGDVAL